MVSYKRNMWYNLSCLLQIYCHMSDIQKLFISWHFWGTCGVINNGCGWRKDVVNQCLEFDSGSSPVAVKSQTLRGLLLITRKQCTMLFFLCLHLWHPGFSPVAMKSQTLHSLLIITCKQYTMLFFLCLHLWHPGSSSPVAMKPQIHCSLLTITWKQCRMPL